MVVVIKMFALMVIINSVHDDGDDGNVGAGVCDGGVGGGGENKLQVVFKLLIVVTKVIDNTTLPIMI